MGKLQNMIGQISSELERLGVEVVGTETAGDRHAAVITDRAMKDGAVRLSKALDGMIFTGTSHLSWASGSFAVAVHTVDTWAKLQPVRECAERITGQPGRFGIGACARQVSAWLGSPEPTNPRLSAIVGDWHYQRCIPCAMPHAFQFDLTACYYNLLRRVPSLRPVFTDDTIFWLESDDAELSRFVRAVDLVADCKPLRNSMIGAFYGGSQRVYLRAGKCHRFTTAPGTRQALAAAIVRTAYEVCQLQADVSSASYANTDSVITDSGRAEFWESVGLPYTVGAAGPAIVQAIGKYAVGSKQTKPFQTDKTGTLRCARESRRVDALYWRWLTTESPLFA